MANRDLLKEAIADAKALKETAIANAKAALEEAFEPRVKEMLSAKLQEMDEDDLEEVVNEANSEDLEEAKRAEDKETKRTEKMKYGKDLAEGEEDLDEILAELDKEMGENKDMNEAEEAEEEEVDIDMEMEDDEDIDLEEMSEDELKSFIEDVIKDMVESGELEAGEEFEVEDEESEDEEIEIEDEDETEEIMEGEETNMEEGMLDKLKAVYNDPEVLGKLITVDGKKMSLKDFLAMAASGATGGMKKSGAGKTSSIGEADELDERQKYAGNKGDVPAAKRGDKKDTAEEEGVEDYKKRMKEELDELRNELNEVNLLNAKLLFTNKIFRAKNLMETQKVKVLEAFDKATTVKEVKLVYETLNEGIKEKAPIRENLGSASKPAGVAPKQQIVEVDSQFARWQKLAGIIK
jgi:hypothetical protein